MPYRAPIDPLGYYHVSARGSYGRVLFPTVDASLRFLSMYERAAQKYRWETLAWVLMNNHHHFVVLLTDGGLSEGMRELHGGYSRWFHEQTGETRKGHLFRHAFFARQLRSESDIVLASSYVDLNPVASRLTGNPEASIWCGYRASVGLEQPRPFHRPSKLLELIDADPIRASRTYKQLVHDQLTLRRQGCSPNDVTDLAHG